MPKKQFDMAPARADGRPLYFDVPHVGEGGVARTYQCAKCAVLGLEIHHPGPKVVMNDPANAHDRSGAVYTYCNYHIPNDAVIYSPVTGLCRDKSGQNTWREMDGGKKH